MIAVNLPPLEGDAPGSSDATLHCDVCHSDFDSIEALNSHLLSFHRLAFRDWIPERDLMSGQPVCAHCSQTFGDRSLVRQHVMQGYCKDFDPFRSPHVLPISPFCHQILASGDFAPVLGLRFRV